MSKKNELLPFSGAEGPKAPTAARTDEEARARVAELSENFSDLIAREYSSFVPGIQEEFDPGTRSFSGVDSTPLDKRDPTKSFDEVCQEAVEKKRG